MEEKSRHKSLKNLTKALMIAVAALLLAGEAGAQTSSCDNLANVTAWNGNISFLYSNSGSKNPPGADFTQEWNIQQSTDVSFRLDGLGGMYSTVIGSQTGVVNINDRSKITYSGKNPPPPLTTTMQGSGSPDFLSIATMQIDRITCKYKFTFQPYVNGVETSNNVPTSLNILVGQLTSGLYPIPITSSILSGSANFPVYLDIVPLTDMDMYAPGGLFEFVNTFTHVDNPGSATVTWEFKPAGFPSPTLIEIWNGYEIWGIIGQPGSFYVKGIPSLTGQTFYGTIEARNAIATALATPTGGKVDDVALFQSDGWWAIKYDFNSATNGNADKWIAFGDGTGKPVAGDFRHTGAPSDVAILKSNGWWAIKYDFNNASNFAAADKWIAFGDGTAKPVVGDFDHDGFKDDVALLQSNGWWAIKYNFASATNGTADKWISFGDGTAKPVVGDFNGDGFADDVVLLQSNGWWAMKYNFARATNGTADKWISFGDGTAKPVVGDFNGDGFADDVALLQSNGWWAMKYNFNSATNGSADKWIAFGDGTAQPVVGNFNNN